MSAGMSHTHWTAKLFIKKKVNQSTQSNSHTLTDSHFHIKKKKKKDAEGGRTYKPIPFFITISIKAYS